MRATAVLQARAAMRDYFKTDPGAMASIAMAEVATLRLEPEQTDANWAEVTKDTDYSRVDEEAYILPRAYKARNLITSHLDMATPYWVSEEMSNLALHAAASRESGPVTIEDFPTSHGFVWFDVPVMFTLEDPDGRTETLAVKIFTWRQGVNVLGQPGVALTYWSSTHQAVDTLGKYLSESAQNPFRKAGPFVVAQQGFLTFGTEQDRPTWWEQFAATFVFLLGMEIVGKRQEKAHPKVVADMKRHRAKVSPVMVVTLRKIKADPNKIGRGTSPNVRVLVGALTGGFWRRQHYGKGGELMKKILILPYMRGPEDAPLVWHHDVIYKWSR